jgi:hypothetical protein
LDAVIARSAWVVAISDQGSKGECNAFKVSKESLRFPYVLPHTFKVGGDAYVRALKAPLSQVPFIAAGVNQLTALKLILSGATALGVGRELIPEEAICLRQSDRIVELSRRLPSFVNNGRIRATARKDSIWQRQ